MKVTGDLAAVIAVGILTLFAVAWVVMILAGMWHGIRPAVPPIGFGEAVVVTALGHTLTGSVGASRSNT